MTIKKAFIRYLKDKGLYGFLVNKIPFHRLFIFNKEQIENLYYYLCYKLREEGLGNCWIYSRNNKTFCYFIEKELFINEQMPKYGDTVSATTIDGKYEFEYSVVGMDGGERVLLEGGQTIYLERVSKINGKKVDYKNKWELRNVRVFNVIENYLK